MDTGQYQWLDVAMEAIQMTYAPTTDMKSRLNAVWRLFATGASFTLFGLGGLLFGVLAFPPLLLITDRMLRRRIARRAIQKMFRFFIEFMRIFGVLSYELSGFSQLHGRRGMLVIANHPTLLDVVFLVAFLDDVDCIVKKEIFKNPFMLGPVATAEFIPNDTDNPEQFINLCVSRLNEGANLIIFPEGTRTVTHQGYRLQRGASNIAIRSDTAPTPILISCHPPTLRKGEKWYKIPHQKMHFSLRVQPDFPIHPYTECNPSIAARRLTQDLTLYFSESIPNG